MSNLNWLKKPAPEHIEPNREAVAPREPEDKSPASVPVGPQALPTGWEVGKLRLDVRERREGEPLVSAGAYLLASSDTDAVRMTLRLPPDIATLIQDPSLVSGRQNGAIVALLAFGLHELKRQGGTLTASGGDWGAHIKSASQHRKKKDAPATEPASGEEPPTA